MLLKDQIRRAREAKSLSQQELADLVGVSRQSVVWWEGGIHTLRPEKQKQLEEIFGIKLDITGTVDGTQELTAVSNIDPLYVAMAKEISELSKEERSVVASLIKSYREKSLVISRYENSLHQGAPETQVAAITKNGDDRTRSAKSPSPQKRGGK